MKRSKLEAYGETLGQSAGCFTAIGVVLVTFSALNWIFKLLEYVVINVVYGHAAWAQGLRVVGNKGALSNGDFLSGWASHVLYLGTFILTVPFFLGSFWLFSYIGMRRSGRRLGDPKPKKK